jgi:predicted nucleic acid-binding protein
MKRYALDANALLALVNSEPGAERVRSILHESRETRAECAISVLSWGEVYYVLWQKRGEEKARQTLAKLARTSIQIIPVELPQALKAAELNAQHKIPYVDCIAAALAGLQQATLVTSDRDFEKLGRHFQILWLSR